MFPSSSISALRRHSARVNRAVEPSFISRWTFDKARICLKKYSSSNGPSQKSPHAQWYSETLPAMIPIALLGSTVYLGLHLVQVQLANEKHLDEANKQIRQLEEELNVLRAERDKRQEKANAKMLPETIDKKSRWWFTGY